ncbi:hypothetical protein MSAN_00543100 [Mycena sanguinolenta]|uniref:Uncharacterized protein n=1 Tax=Mycena sanguinolenta TaxID=230812 RepID=A0A8H6Z693_9AGAR|nr:hypothetical protein MSAN_00543100 [Mycena sanguinolenta]
MSTTPTPTLSAHAARNPSKPVQPPRQRARKSDARSATQTVNDAKLKNEEMLAEVDAFQELRHEKVKELAIKYEKDEAFFLKLLANRSHYSGTRNTMLWNAFKHDLSKQAKENGESKSTIELNEEAKEKYEEFKKNLTEDDKKELIAQLEDYRELQHKGVRATNKSAGADAMQNALRIGHVMRDMYERTGVRAIALFTRGNPDDPCLPHIEDSDEARRFFQEELKLDILDAMRKFERWSCLRDSGGPKENHKLTVIMKEISEMLNEGLQKIKNDTTVSMEYVNYRFAIVYQLGVELAGWPSWVEMARASKLSAENAREIHRKLKSGEIHWVALTKSQREAVAKEIEEQRAQGPLKSRKQRSDKGMERGPQDKTVSTNAAQDGDTPAVANSALPTGAASSAANPAVSNTAVPSVMSIANAAVPAAANAAVPAAANSAGLSIANTAVPFANAAFPFTANAIPFAANDVVAIAANTAPSTTPHDPLSITTNIAGLDNSFFDNLANFDPNFDPLQFDYTELDLSLSSLPPLPEDPPFPDLRLNTSNIGNDVGLRTEPAVAAPHDSVGAHPHERHPGLLQHWIWCILCECKQRRRQCEEETARDRQRCSSGEESTQDTLRRRHASRSTAKQSARRKRRRHRTQEATQEAQRRRHATCARR